MERKKKQHILRSKLTCFRVTMTDTLKYSLAKIPVIDILPHMATIAQARQQFFEDIQLKMSERPENQRFSFN